MSPWLRHFMLISVVGMTVLLASLLFFHVQLSRDYLDEHLATHNRNLAIVLRNSVQSAALQRELMAGNDELSGETIAEIDKTLDRELKWVPVAKVKVYSTDSIVMYSTAKEEISRNARNNSGVQKALRGESVSDLVRRDQRNELDGSVEKVDLHQQYIPIKDPVSGKIAGVFEVYANVSQILAHVGAKQRAVFWTIAGILLAFYLALAMSFTRTHRLLLAERRQREKHLNEVLQVRAELEQRVEERTAELDRSKTFLQSVIDGIGTPLLVIRPNFTIALMNHAARRLLPKDAGPSSYRYCYQISHRRDSPCDGADHPCSFGQVMKHGRAARVRHTHYDANNQPILVDLVSTPLYSESGDFEGVIEVEHDVTQLVRMQAGLIESEARLQAIMDNVPDAILTCGADGEIRSVNPSALRMLASAGTELIGRRLESILQREIAPDAYQSGKTMQSEYVIQRGDDSTFPAEVWIGPMNLDGDPSCIAVIRDITARQAAQEELEKTRQQYFHQEKMAAIGQLAAGILHEVGNPIAAIAGAAGELKNVNICGQRPLGDCPYDDVVARNIDLIDEQTKRLSKITREIADFASPRPRERELLDLNSLIRSTARLLSYDRRFSEVNVDLRLDKSLPAIIGVADQLTQVFMNLLINALDACSCVDAQAPHTITLKSELDGDRAHVMVRDDGCGMSEDTLSRVMEPFFTTKPVGKGTGLGLSLCDTIVLAHGGFLHIDSREGKGTTVHVFLPTGDNDKNETG